MNINSSELGFNFIMIVLSLFMNILFESTGWSAVLNDKKITELKSMAIRNHEMKLHIKEAWNYQEIGSQYRMANQNKPAYEYYSKALEIFERYNDQDGIESICSEMAIIYTDWGWLEKALELYLRGIRILELKRDSTQLGYALSNIAGVYGTFLKMDQSIEYNYKALQIFNKLNNKHGLGYIHNNLGNVFYMIKLYDSAIFHYLVSLSYKKQISDIQGIVFVQNNLGRVFLLKNELQQAKLHFDQATELSMNLDDELCRLDSYISMASFYIDTDNNDKALLLLSKAAQIALKTGHIVQLKDISFNLYQIYYNQGNLKKAFRHFQKYNELKDSLFKIESQRAIAEMSARYDTELKESQISRLNTENQFKSLQLKQSQNLNVKLFIAIFLFALFASIVVTMYIQKLRAYQILVEKNLESVENEKILDKTLVVGDVDSMENSQNNRKMIPDELTNQILYGLTELIGKQKIYLDPEITLAEVAKRLNTNTAYLSKVINEQTKTSFSTYINENRVKEARRMLADDHFGHISIEGIAGLVGFNSKSAFNTAFRKFTGLTPSMFQNSVKRLKDKTAA